jgi:hypothetical protein
MKRAKKRWAWKAQYKRPHFKDWHSRPDVARWYHQRAQTIHRAQTRQALSRLRQGDEEGHVTFPYHHHHWLKWWWC